MLFILGAKFENLEDERQLTSGTALLYFRANPNDRIDVTLSRFEMARLEAESVGFPIPNFQLLAVILFNAVVLGLEGSVWLHLILDGDPLPVEWGRSRRQ